MKKIYLTALLLIGLIVSGNAQSYWAINWDISTGLGDTGNFVEGINFRGVSIDGRGFVNENLSIGGFFSWNALYDKKSDMEPFEFSGDDYKGNISGTQSNYLNVFPVLLTGHYFFDTGSDVRPYFGIGLGTVYTEQRTDFGLLSFYDDSWGFGAQPEFGVYLPLGLSGGGLNLALRYLYGSSGGDLDSLSMLTFAIGFAFMN